MLGKYPPCGFVRALNFRFFPTICLFFESFLSTKNVGEQTWCIHTGGKTSARPSFKSSSACIFFLPAHFIAQTKNDALVDYPPSFPLVRCPVEPGGIKLMVVVVDQTFLCTCTTNQNVWDWCKSSQDLYPTHHANFVFLEARTIFLSFFWADFFILISEVSR